jgi:hypothetical protein
LAKDNFTATAYKNAASCQKNEDCFVIRFYSLHAFQSATSFFLTSFDSGGELPLGFPQILEDNKSV